MLQRRSDHAGHGGNGLQNDGTMAVTFCKERVRKEAEYTGETEGDPIGECAGAAPDRQIGWRGSIGRRGSHDAPEAVRNALQLNTPNARRYARRGSASHNCYCLGCCAGSSILTPHIAKNTCVRDWTMVKLRCHVSAPKVVAGISQPSIG